MTPDQIIELFTKAAEVDRKLPDTARPAPLKAMNMGYVHSYADIAGYGEQHREEWFRAWLDPANLRNSKNDMGLWAAAMELIKLVPNENQRRCLWAWSRAEAGGQPFAKWCKTVEGISRQLGLWRKNAAIECIASTFARKPLQHNQMAEDGGFTTAPEIGDKGCIITVWRPETSKPVCGFDDNLRNFDWATAQNARRRERKARKQQAA
jgi:hypothetical protein